MADASLVVLGLESTGLVLASCLAGPDRPVVAVEPDPGRRRALQHGRLPFFEPGLEPLFREALGCGWLQLVDRPPERARVFCVAADPEGLVPFLLHVESGSVLALHGPVPVGTSERLQARLLQLRGGDFLAGVVTNPLFLRRGRAVQDFLRPRWVLLGGSQRWAVDAVAELYRGSGALVVRTDHRTAEAAARLAEELPDTLRAVLDRFRELSDSWNADFELLRRLVLSEVAEVAFRRYVHGGSRERARTAAPGAVQLLAR